MRAELQKAGAFPHSIGPKRQKIKSVNGSGVGPDHSFKNMCSHVFDAIFVPRGSSIAGREKESLVRFWIRETFGYLNAIGAVRQGLGLIAAAAAEADGGELAAENDDHVIASCGVIRCNAPKAGTWNQEEINISADAQGCLNTFFCQILQHSN